MDHWNKRWRELANNALKPLRPEDREFFRLVQPYHAFWPSENIGSVYQHPLAMLERLWLTDKHRLLVPALYALEGFNQSDVEVEDAIMGPRSWARRPLRVGVVAFTFHWTITGPSPSFHWSGAVRSRLAFEDGIDVLETLDAGHAAVAEILVGIEQSRP